MDDDEERLWYQTICGNGENFDLEAGETKEISFTGNCPAERPKIKGRFELVEQTDMSDTETWDVLESQYGARYGKMETYLVADTVWGTDLLFVFDEKRADGYTATAELTNVVPLPPVSSEDEDNEEDASGQAMDAIADWEIYLECEDTIESITGAEIVFHEGNIYHIRTTDPTQWIAPYSFTTFQVRVSSPTGIHPLGKTYLKRAKMRASDDSNAVERSSIDQRMDFRWVDLRTDENQLMFKVQTTLVNAMRQHLLDEGFVEIHTPKLIGTTSESGSDIFEVKYFDGSAYLAQSPQFYKQMAMAGGLERIFEVGPVFRAEKSFTNKHAMFIFRGPNRLTP